jgi:hypothetical protein
MHANRPLVPALVRGILVLAAGLALVLSGAVQPAAASSDPLPVTLGAHRFGHLRAPDSIVAHADPDEVGFFQPPEGQDGVAFGPWSFDVAQDGSIWLLDEVKHRLLAWRPGRPEHPARSVRLPQDPLERVADFAVAPDHSIYATYVPPPGPGPKTLRLAKLTPDGKVLWTAPTTDEIFNAQLRIGPDNSLYVVGGHTGILDWTPLTTPAGRPLPVADQRRGTSRQQPLPDGLRLAGRHSSSDHAWRYTLSSEAGRVLRSWRITSENDLGAPVSTAALVGGDPVVVLEIARETKADFLYEYEVLRLARGGGAKPRFSIDAHAVWGDTPITGVRVGPDGQLYQLRTSRTKGVDIARYVLDPVQNNAPPTTGPAPKPPTPTGPRVDEGGLTAPPVTQPPAQPATPAADPAATHSAFRPWLPWLAGVTASALAGLVMWLLYRRRHPAGLEPHERSRVAS